MPTSQWMRWNSTTHILELSTDFGATWAPLSLDAAVLTAGVVALARGGTGVDLSAAGGATKVLAQDAAHVVSARNLIAADIPNLSAAIITSGLLALARGGVNADLSATGGASQYLKQAAAGAAITVARPTWADIDKTVSSLADLTTRSAADLSSGILPDATLAGLFTRFSQVVVNLTGTAVLLFGGATLNNSMTLISVSAPNSDTATFICNSMGGLSVGWIVGWLSRNGAVNTNSVSWTMAGAGAQDYTLSVASGSGQISINKTSVGTLTGNTTVKALRIAF